MNHETTIKRIQELVPSVMALEFGCEVMYKTSGWGRNKYTITKVMRDDKYRINRLDDIYDLEDMAYGYDFEILGKPITLAVVMLAIATEYNPKNTSTFLNIDSNGEFCWTTTTDLRGGTMKVIEPIISWNLSNDNFNDQSEETKTFIGVLLN